MSTDTGLTAEHLDTLLRGGVDAKTHHSKLRKLAKELAGVELDKEGLQALRAALEEATPEQSEGTVYRALRRFPLRGENYLPGDPVPVDKLSGNQLRVLVARQFLSAGEVPNV